MKFFSKSGFLILALISGLMASTGHAQEPMESATVSQPVDDLSSASLKTGQLGEWLWILSADPLLLAGASAVASDPIVTSTFYAGGVGFVAVSRDNGENWETQMSFVTDDEDDAGIQNDEALEDIFGDSDVEQKLDTLKEYLRSELEQQFGQSYADSLIDEMTDDELLKARDVNDIEVLEELELDMDPDLTQIAKAGETSYASVLSDFDSFRERYDAMIAAGATEDVAIRHAGKSFAVWNFVTTGTLTYAVTAGGIYVTGDVGKTWRSIVTTPDDASILAMDVSADAQHIAIGTTKGLILSHNGGASWFELSQVIEGAAYEVYFVPSLGHENLVVLTTETLYESRDEGLTWNEVDIPFSTTENVVSVQPGHDGKMVVLSNLSIYLRDDDASWKRINTAPLADETIRQIVVADPSLSKIAVRTDAHIFELTAEGWIPQSRGLFSEELGQFAYAHVEPFEGIIASPSGVWVAQRSKDLEVTPEYRALMDQWAKEPTDDQIIDRALMAHFINGWADENWSTRARLSWLLPVFTFDYYFKQRRYDRDTRVYNAGAGYLESEKFAFLREETSYWQVMALWKINIEKGQRDEISAKNTMRQLISNRERLIKQVNAEIRKRKAYQMRLTKDAIKSANKKIKKASKKNVRLHLALWEIEAHLHYLTDGFFIPATHQNDPQN